MPSPVRENLQRVRARIAAAEQRARTGPPGRAVELLAVTKSVPAAAARELALAGQRDLAENRIESLEAKAQALAQLDVRWHFIGHVQRNKARRIVALADVVHSVDSARLVLALERLAAELERRIDVFIQVNAAREEQKYGLAPEELPEAVELLRDCPHLRLLGLMAMGPTSQDEQATRAAFATTARLARELEARPSARELLAEGRCRLSMGMSDDLELAVEAGSDVVRVGRALFLGLGSGSGEAASPRVP